MTTETVVKQKTTPVFDDIVVAYAEGKRRILLEGGTYSSKTWSALQALIIIAQKATVPLLISIVSESLPHLKGGAMKDFFAILEEPKENNPYFNISESKYTRPDWKGGFEFFGADSEGKALGPRRDILFINQGEHIPWETARHLDQRTEIFTIVDWNPSSEFWAHEYWKDSSENAYNHSTYKDALDVISTQKVADIEAWEDKDPNYWHIYGLGLLGKIEGKVYPHFEQVDELPNGDKFYGLDWGFLIDPTVLVENVIVGDKLYSKEMFYDTSGMTNDQIARAMTLLGIKNEVIYADPDEPKSMEELRKLGFNMGDTIKGKGSVKFGEQRVNQYYQHWTKESTNCIKEQRNFRYIEDRVTKVLTDRTTHRFSHGMDSLVAGTLIKTKRGGVKIEDVVESDYVLTRAGWKRVLFSGMTSPSKDVCTLSLSNGKSITGTAGHEIWVKGKGFTLLNACRYGDIMEVCPEKQLSTMGRIIPAILKPSIGQTECITGQDQKQSGISIAKYGLTITELFLKVARYTTRIRTPLTMSCQTLSVCLTGGINSTIQPLSLNGSVNGLGTISGNISKKPMSGTSHLKVRSIIANLASSYGKVKNLKPISANNVVTNTSPGRLIRKLGAFALISVNYSIAGTQAGIILLKSVSGVVSLLKRISIGKRTVAPVSVLSVSESHKEKQPVFDLTTEDMPEFYANGVLVHNSRRYAVASRIQSKGKPRVKRASWRL